jgi:hypothetical protein
MPFCTKSRLHQAVKDFSQTCGRVIRQNYLAGEETGAGALINSF